MAITTDDFNKVWASTSPLTPYSFSASQYKEGWNFIGSTPPSRQMWDFLQKNNDEKMQYLLTHFDNYLPLSGGTLTGVVNGVTPTAGDNSTKIATTEFVNAKAGNYLPLTGGTMAGSIQYINNGKVFAIGNTTTGNVDLGWNWENRDGAGLGLKSTDYGGNGSTNAGGFSLFARDSANDCSLEGKPDGSLTWDNKDVERVNARGTNYIRYENGLQICWDNTQDITTSGNYTITYPVSFARASSVMITIGRWWATSSTENYYLHDATETNVILTTIGSVSTGAHKYMYIAVGYWK